MEVFRKQTLEIQKKNKCFFLPSNPSNNKRGFAAQLPAFNKTKYGIPTTTRKRIQINYTWAYGSSFTQKRPHS